MIDKLWSKLEEQIEKSYEQGGGICRTWGELEQLQKHPLHQARVKRFNQEKKELEQYITKYKDKYSELKECIDSKVESCTYGKGGGTLHRGVLSPTGIIDVLVGNVKRGRLLKKYTDNVDYIYGFDKENQLCRVEIMRLSPLVEYIVYENGIEIGLTYDMDGNLMEVSKCQYKDGRIVSYQHGYSIEETSFFSLDSEKYDYNQKDKVLVTWEEITGDVYQYRQIEVLLNEDGYATTYKTYQLIGDKVMNDVYERKFDRKANFFLKKENKEKSR